MKKYFLLALLPLATLHVTAQDDEETEKKLFKKQNLFTGGSVTAAFYRGGTVLGLSPYFGYSINRFVDVAASVNFTYTSQRDVSVYGDKARQTVWGPGAFVRLFPVKFLFAQAQYEHNFTQVKYIPPANSGIVSNQYKINASSFLVGGGYCSGRQGTGDIFYYFSVMWDLKRDANSPYTDGLGRAIPITRAGIQVPLFQGVGRRRR
jgi:hypothetical protein